MVIFFTEEDLVSFGEYMLSDERRRSFQAHPDFHPDTVEDRLKVVHEADLSNWAFQQQHRLERAEYGS